MAEDKPEKSGSRLRTIILIVVIVVLLLVIAVGATIFFLGGLSRHSHGKSHHGHTTVVKPPPIYFAIKPAMIVNFQNPTKARYLQVGIDVMTRDKKVIKSIKADMPAIRNRLIILLSDQKYAQISTPAGKEKLRLEVRKSINSVLKKNSNNSKEKGSDHSKSTADKVDKIYFTKFVMQ